MIKINRWSTNTEILIEILKLLVKMNKKMDLINRNFKRKNEKKSLWNLRISQEMKKGKTLQQAVADLKEENKKKKTLDELKNERE